ncbi:MAG: BamA/TamA family outer membrane protein [Gammaproteobacteria bacterium]|nr:BamA/TamA family outer membrane protein [Gammaproteobacteria bacterium]
MGAGLTWLTGLGPLTFGIAKAFNTGPLDEEEFFQFELGRTF